MSKRDGGPDDCAHRFLKAHRAGQAVCVYCGKPLHNIAPPAGLVEALAHVVGIATINISECSAKFVFDTVEHAAEFAQAVARIRKGHPDEQA